MPHGSLGLWSPRRAAAALLALAFAASALALAGGCGLLGPHAPRHYLAITHPALNRVTFYDLDANRTVGALPAQKLPHDMLLSPDGRTLDVVNSGSQCMTSYHLDSPELWRRAHEFLREGSPRDTLLGAPGPAMDGAMHCAAPGGSTDGALHGASDARAPGAPESDFADSLRAMMRRGAPLDLNPDPVQSLPRSVAEFHLTDPTFPDSVRAIHTLVHAFDHSACFDCHARSRGGKPFGPVFVEDGRSIALVQLAYRNVVLLDASTGAVRRRIPLALSDDLMPVEIWFEPRTSLAFVTCRNRIGLSRPGVILVVDLADGHTVRAIPAGIYPWHLVPDPQGQRLFVDNFQSSRISVVDVARQAIVDSFVVQNGPSTMLFAPGGRQLYVSCFYTHRLLVVNLASHAVERAIPVGSNPTSLLLSADGRSLDVLCGGESEIDRVDLRSNTVVERHPLLFGAYAFQLVDSDRSGRWLQASASAPAP